MSDVEFLSPIETILDDATQGKMFILVDDEDRENEGDLVIPAEMASAWHINFMAKYGRGLICLAMDKQQIEKQIKKIGSMVLEKPQINYLFHL